jgi:hypothetical protein
VAHPPKQAPPTPSPNDAVSRPHQKAPLAPLPNDIVSPTSTNDFVLMLHLDLEPTQPVKRTGPKWKNTARKSALRAQAQKLKAQASTSSNPLSNPDQEPNKVKGPSGPNLRSYSEDNPRSFIHLLGCDTWQEHKWDDPPRPMSPYPVR